MSPYSVKRAGAIAAAFVLALSALLLVACAGGDAAPVSTATPEVAATVIPTPSPTGTAIPAPTATPQPTPVPFQAPPAIPATPAGVGGPDYIISKQGRMFYAQNGFTGDVDFVSPSASRVIELVLKAIQDPDGTIRNRHVLILGSGSFSPAYHLERRLDFPPMQNTVVDARSVTFVGQGIRIDSVMDGWITLGVVAGRTAGVALDLDPRTVGPDQLIVAVDSQIAVSSIAGSGPPYAAGSIGLRLRASKGDISRLVIKVINVHGFETLVARELGVGRTFMANSLHFQALYEGYRAFGADIPDQGRDSENHYQFAIVGRLRDSGVDIAGRNSTYILSIVPGATPQGEAVRFIGSASGNTLVAGNELAGIGFSRSAALDNRIIAPGLGASGTTVIPAGEESVTVFHGLRQGITPVIEDISVNPTNGLGNAGKFWVDNPTANTFTIHVDSDPGPETATFAWRIETQ